MRSPTQVTQPADRQALLSRAHRGLVSLLVRRISTTMLSLGIVTAIGFVSLQGLLQTSSVEAVINARVTRCGHRLTERCNPALTRRLSVRQ